MLGTILTFLAVGIATILVAGVVLSILGALFSLTFGLAMFLLTKVAPVMVLGWVVLKLVERARNRPRLGSGDTSWLDD